MFCLKLTLKLNNFLMFNVLLQHTYCMLLEKVFLGALLIQEVFHPLCFSLSNLERFVEILRPLLQVGQRLDFHLLKRISFLRLGENQAKLVHHQSQRRFVGSDLCFTTNAKQTHFVFHLSHSCV